MKKVQEARREYMSIAEDTHPQETTQKVGLWRNSIDGFQKDLDSHGKFLKSLMQDTPNVTIGSTKGLQKLLKVSEKYSNDLKTIINMLKTLTFIPKNCEFCKNYLSQLGPDPPKPSKYLVEYSKNRFNSGRRRIARVLYRNLRNPR